MNAVAEKARARPNWGIVTELEAHVADRDRTIALLEDAKARASQELDAMRRRVSKWAGLAALVGFLVGAVAGKAF